MENFRPEIEYSLLFFSGPQLCLCLFLFFLFCFKRFLTFLFSFRSGYLQDYCEDLNEFPLETALSQYWKNRLGKGVCLPIDERTISAILGSSITRAWLYQQCSGLGGIGNTASSKQPFGTMLTVELFYEVCELEFGDS